MSCSIVADFQSRVSRANGAAFGVLRHSDGQLEAFGCGKIAAGDIDDLAKTLVLMALRIRRKAQSLGATPAFPFSAASILSFDTAMRTFDIKTAAPFLHVSVATMVNLASTGAVPGAMIRKRWVFTDESLETYLRQEIERQARARQNAVIGVAPPVKKRRGCIDPVL